MRVLMILAVVLGMGAAIAEAMRAPTLAGYDVAIAMGTFDPSPDQIEQGYFVLGSATMLAVMPGSVPHDRLKEIANARRQVEILIRVHE